MPFRTLRGGGRQVLRGVPLPTRGPPPSPPHPPPPGAPPWLCPPPLQLLTHVSPPLDPPLPPPLPPPAAVLQVLEFESNYLDALPSAEMYERSYMHRDEITHVVVRQPPTASRHSRSQSRSRHQG